MGSCGEFVWLCIHFVRQTLWHTGSALISRRADRTEGECRVTRASNSGRQIERQAERVEGCSDLFVHDKRV